MRIGKNFCYILGTAYDLVILTLVPTLTRS